MSWVKLDDQFADHPKVIEAGPLASWLYVCGLTYAARYLTDGYIPAGQVRKLADIDDPLAMAERLVSVGMWEHVDGGYMIHDYLQYNPCKEDVLATRAARAEAGSKGGTISAQARAVANEQANAQANAQANEQQNSTPSPSPSPSPIPSPSVRSGAKSAPPTATQSARKQRKREGSGDEDKRTNPLVAAFAKAWGYPAPAYAQEGAAAKAALKQYEASDLLGCYHWLKQKEFWADQHLSIASVHKQVGAWIAAGRPKEYSGNGSGGRARASPHHAAMAAFLADEPEEVKT